MNLPPVPTPPRLPEYDPATNGNPFAWIVKEAGKVREQRMAYNIERRIALRLLRQG